LVADWEIEAVGKKNGGPIEARRRRGRGSEDGILIGGDKGAEEAEIFGGRGCCEFVHFQVEGLGTVKFDEMEIGQPDLEPAVVLSARVSDVVVAHPFEKPALFSRSRRAKCPTKKKHALIVSTSKSGTSLSKLYKLTV
jgi:hypothetical protein